MKKVAPKFVPFKKKLIRFIIALVTVIAIFVVPLEIYRPFETLQLQIEKANNFIAGVQSSWSDEDLAAVNGFATRLAEQNYEADWEDDDLLYAAMAFNILLQEEQLPSEAEILDSVEYFEEFSEPFAYANLKRWYQSWDDRLTKRPTLLKILRDSKRALIKAMSHADKINFELTGIYVMLDAGQKQGLFESNIVYVLDSVPWWSDTISSSIGELYEISDNEFWRASALAGKTEWQHNKVFDPENYYLPQFDSDEWGDWFSVWYTQESSNGFNIFNIDFNASQVKNMMLLIGLVVFAVTLLLLVITIIAANWYSRLVTRPLTELSKGAGEVAKGNYEHVVPLINNDEFGALTSQFNRMTRGQKERLNLMDTLEKFLSRELAEKAAESGLTLGGQKANCSMMFTDFAGFSTITQSMSAVETVTSLNEYFEALIPIIKKYGGFTDKFIGDGIVALFGAPVVLQDHAERAVCCAIGLQKEMRAFNQKRRAEDKPVFEMRIGINTGDVIVGAIGCDMKLEYTSIGEDTNLANRMESVCEIGHIMLAHNTYEQVENLFFKGVLLQRVPEFMEVKGYAQGVACYRLFIDQTVVEKVKESNSWRDFYRYQQEPERPLYQHPEEVVDAHLIRHAKYID